MTNLPASIPPRNFSIFTFGEHEIRVIRDENGEPLFVGNDVCKALTISDAKQAIERLDDDERGRYYVPTGGGIQQMTCITEPGLYNLILRSDKPAAKEFKRWITHDVLPALRKTGSYSLQEMTPLQQLKAMVAYMEQTESNIKDLYVKQGEAALQLEQVIERLDNADYFTVRQWCQKQRIKTTASVRSMWGKAAADLSRERGVEIGEVNEGPYSVGQYHKSILAVVCVARPKPGQQMDLLG